METIHISKAELKSLIREALEEFFPKIGFVSDKEQKELEKEFGISPSFDEADQEERVKIYNI